MQRLIHAPFVAAVGTAFALGGVFGLALALAGCALGGAGGGTGVASQADSCPPSPAPALFANALCLCGDLASVGASLTTSSPAGGAASVGVNGMSNVVGADHVDGSFVAYSGLGGTGSIGVRDDLVSTGDVRGVGQLDVGHDLSVGGSLADVGALSVGGTLRVAGSRLGVGVSEVQAEGAYAAPAGPPCPCDGSTFLDVGAKVAAAKAQNDNAAHKLPTSLALVGAATVKLATGSYYFDHVESVGALHFEIDGVVALYLDGSLDAVGADLVSLAPGATLDLYVAGSVRTVGALALGADPSAVRLYVADGAILSVGAQTLGAMIYAPTANIGFVGDTTVHGAVFAHSLDGVGLLSIDYAAAQAQSPSQCGTPPSGGTPSSGAGSTGSPPIQ